MIMKTKKEIKQRLEELKLESKYTSPDWSKKQPYAFLLILEIEIGSLMWVLKDD